MTTGRGPVWPGGRQFADRVRSHFGFLFTDYGFNLDRIEEASAGDRCLLIPQRPFRVKILYGRGDQAALVSRRDAPTTWKNKVNGARVWLSA
jgi:hypothetical protein